MCRKTQKDAEMYHGQTFLGCVTTSFDARVVYVINNGNKALLCKYKKLVILYV